jgi:hypothetical protein
MLQKQQGTILIPLTRNTKVLAQEILEHDKVNPQPGHYHTHEKAHRVQPKYIL